MERETALLQKRSGPCKLGENQDAMALGLACDILKGDEIHAVARGGQQTGVGQRVQRRQFREGNRTVDVDERSSVGRG